MVNGKGWESRVFSIGLVSRISSSQGSATNHAASTLCERISDFELERSDFL